MSVCIQLPSEGNLQGRERNGNSALVYSWSTRLVSNLPKTFSLIVHWAILLSSTNCSCYVEYCRAVFPKFLCTRISFGSEKYLRILTSLFMQISCVQMIGIQNWKFISQNSSSFLPLRDSPSGPRLPHRGFVITLRHTTLGRTPLDEWSTRRRVLYQTSHNTHNRQTSMAPAGQNWF